MAKGRGSKVQSKAKPKRRKPKHGRPRKAQTQLIDVPGSAWLYYKPIWNHGKWRVRRRPRADASAKIETLCIEKEITLPNGKTDTNIHNLGEAIEVVRDMAKAEAEKAVEATKPPEERKLDEITLEALWGRWTTAREGLETFRESTKTLHESARVKILAALGASTPAHAVTLADIEAFFADLRRAPAKRKPDEPIRLGRSGRTLLFYLQKLRALFEHAEDHGHVHVSPLAKFKAPKTWGADARAAAEDTGQALTPDELRSLIQAAGQPFEVDYTPKTWKKKLKRQGRKTRTKKRKPPRYLALAITIAALSGLRRGNIIGPNGLRWGDLDLTDGEESLQIDRDRMKLRSRRLDNSKAAPFCVPINRELAAVLRAERKRLGRVPKKDARVIPGLLDFKAAWSRLIKRAGFSERGLRFHDIRHSYSTIIAGYAPGLVVSRLMDHSKGKSTTHRYGTRQELSVLREWVNKFPRLTEKNGLQGVAIPSGSR